MRRVLYLLGTFLLCNALNAQVLLVDSVSPIDMVNRMAGSGVEILSASLGPCNGLSSGTFDQTGPENQIGIRSGTVITNSKLITYVYPGFLGLIRGVNVPNGLSLAGTYQWVAPYDTALSLMVDTDVHNVLNTLPAPNIHVASSGLPKLSERYRCALEFDFVPHLDSIQFKYVFAHEIASRGSCASYNNPIFCAFLSRADSVGSQNIALVPGTDYPVCFNTINLGRDSILPADTAYRFPFCRNIGPGVPFSEYWREQPPPTIYPDSLVYCYTGWSTPLWARSAVNACDTYHLKVIISIPEIPGTTGSSGLAAFIEAGSFQSYSGAGCTDTSTAINPIKKPEDFALAFPNPFSSSFELKLQGSAVRSSYHVRLLSALGQQLYQGSGSLRGINYELKQLAPTLPAGLYFVSITDVKGAQQVLKVSKR